MDKEIFLTEFGHLAQGLDGVKKLRDLILQLAVQGKLVEQDLNDEPASVLLDKVEEQKNKLINEGIIKKKKRIATELEHSVLLPEKWEKETLGNVAFLLVDGSHNPPPKQPTGIPMLSGQNVLDGAITYDASRYITEENYQGEIKRTPIEKGDVFLSIVGTIGRSAVVPDKFPRFALQRSIALIRTSLESHYLSLFLRSPFAKKYYDQNAKGTAQKGIYLGKLSELTLLIPPLAEQKRIVAKVDELMTLCDELEATQKANVTLKRDCVASTLHHLSEASDKDEIKSNWSIAENNFGKWFDDLETVKNLRATILQLAVQGKLVEQDPNDEPASVLLDKVKSTLPEPKGRKRQHVSISLDNVPFNIPSSWTWARFPELGEFGRGKSKHRPRNDPKLYLNGDVPLVQTGDVARSSGEITTYTALYNKEGLAQSRLWEKGTMCITIAANIADSGILTFNACFPDSIVGFVPSAEFSDARYFEYFLRTAKEDLLKFAPSTAQKNINLSILEQVAIPLPPLAEQKRIVAKVDEVMALCDELETQIMSSQTLNQNLMASLCHHMTVN
ncbi:restriction endonuclease subunit S [Thalassospira australica]|uniref:restriction endonuclease subunit S n=1 Tax=Thalassospira australica TaxID=1528106 RepID=UPI00068D13D3|nr:restriction endonuclease subunit S [Thalassospira australica]